jgi:hypothetical protein
MKNKDLQIARRAARKNVRAAKQSKGFISGENAAIVQKAIANSR